MDPGTRIHLSTILHLADTHLSEGNVAVCHFHRCLQKFVHEKSNQGQSKRMYDLLEKETNAIGEVVKKMLFLCLYLIFLAYVLTQEKVELVCKRIECLELHIKLLHSIEFAFSRYLPIMFFFHDGSWRHGRPSQFAKHIENLLGRAVVTFFVEYRVSERLGTTPYEALMHAKSANRFIGSNADKFLSVHCKYL